VNKTNKALILENLKMAKSLVNKGLLSDESLKYIVERDPHPKKAYTGWMARAVAKDEAPIEDMVNTVEEFHAFVTIGRIQNTDIFFYKNYQQLFDIVDTENQKGSATSNKQKENDYEIFIDNDKLAVYGPNTHEASRKLGLTIFQYRHCKEAKTGKLLYNQDRSPKLDSAWCTTFKASSHWDKYYYTDLKEFVYIRVRDPQLLEQVVKKFGPQYVVFAVAITPNGNLEGWDGKDILVQDSEVRKFLRFIGLEDIEDAVE
jgi:hypothetical protein